MPWKHNGRIIKEGKAWVADDNTKHPGGWLKWTAERKKAMGLVWEDPPASGEPFDNRFYWGRQKDGSLIEKNLIDEDAVDDDGNKLKDIDGNQVVIYGLKTIWIDITKETANKMLSKTEWMVTRKAEKGTAIASATSTFRDKVRTACDSIEKSITDCKTLADFKKLFDTPVDKDGNATGNPVIHDFPEE